MDGSQVHSLLNLKYSGNFCWNLQRWFKLSQLIMHTVNIAKVEIIRTDEKDSTRRKFDFII